MRLIEASWVLPVSGPPIRDGRVAVDEGGIIRWVGRRGDADEPSGMLHDLAHGVLMPGLVNAHCHLELSHLRDLAQRVDGFVPWVEALVAERAVATPEEIVREVERAIRTLEETGTVAVADISNTLVSVEPLARSSLRAVVFHEIIGWDGERAEAVRAAAAAHRGELPGDLEARGVSVRVAAHAPHSVSPALLRALVADGGPAAIHLAESPSECRFLQDGGGDWPDFLKRRGLGRVPFAPSGLSPVQYLEGLGALHAGLLAAHAVHTDEADAALLAERGVSVVVCPSSNRNLQVGVPPVQRLLAAGVRVCLGTDSLASGDELDVAGEMAEAGWLFPDVSAREVIRMATASGAAALGLSDLGTLEAGRRAALAFAPSATPIDDPEAYVVSGEVKLARVRLP
jgi:cytosine/adenosine deaminase-related metal-dependent hydrolase